MMNIPQEKIKAFVAACHKAAAYHLVRCSSGNMSWRVGEDCMLVSASGSWMGEIRPEQVSLCRISDASVIEGPRPSVETVFHAGILRERTEADVVLHFQTNAATTIACGDPTTVNYFVIPEISVNIGEIGMVPYLCPGSPELAAATIETMKTHNLAMMKNHGQVTLGKTFDVVIQNATFFELACEIILRSGEDIEPLSADAIANLTHG